MGEFDEYVIRPEEVAGMDRGQAIFLSLLPALSQFPRKSESRVELGVLGLDHGESREDVRAVPSRPVGSRSSLSLPT